VVEGLECGVCCSVLQCVAVCCRWELRSIAVWCVLQCFAVCCSVLQCVAVCCRWELGSFAVWCVLQCVAVRCSLELRRMSRWGHLRLACVAACFSVLQRVVACCIVLQCVAVCCSCELRCMAWWRRESGGCCSVLQCVAVCCSVVPCGAVCCSVLQCVAVSQNMPRICKCFAYVHGSYVHTCEKWNHDSRLAEHDSCSASHVLRVGSHARTRRTCATCSVLRIVADCCSESCENTQNMCDMIQDSHGSCAT